MTLKSTYQFTKNELSEVIGPASRPAYPGILNKSSMTYSVEGKQKRPPNPKDSALYCINLNSRPLFSRRSEVDPRKKQ